MKILALLRCCGEGLLAFILKLKPETLTFTDGRIVLNDGAPRYQYKITDHLGNTTVLFEDRNRDGVVRADLDNPDASEVLQQDLYYPFGMQLRGTAPYAPEAKHPYLYNGKELMEGTGLYAYGFRYYDPAVGRFTGVDPIADQFAFVSGFNYAENRPISGIDLHGLQYFNMTSRVGLSYSGNPQHPSYDPYINIRVQINRQTRATLRDIKLSATGEWPSGWYQHLYETEWTRAFSSFEKQPNYIKGRGQAAKPLNSYKGNLAILVTEYLNSLNEDAVIEDLTTTRYHFEYLEKSINIVENARGLRLIPDDLSNVDLVNYVLNSETPRWATPETRADVERLGKWLFDWKEDILNDEIPDSGSGDIRDTNYPLPLSRIGIND